MGSLISHSCQYQTNECQNPAPGQAMIMGQSISSCYSRYLGHLQLLERHQGLLRKSKRRLSIVQGQRYVDHPANYTSPDAKCFLQVPYTMFIQGMTKSRRPLTTISSRVYSRNDLQDLKDPRALMASAV